MCSGSGGGALGWSKIVDAASICWGDVADAELAIAAQLFQMLDWGPMCAFRACHVVTAQAFELWAAQPIPAAELSWVRVPTASQAACLRFLGQHCRNARSVAIWETAHLGERLLLRLVCGMRLLESLEVDASPFGGKFPEPGRLFDRLARYCPRLQHLAISFRHTFAGQRQALDREALLGLGRRLLTLDLGAVSVHIAGGSNTIVLCCPQLERLTAQLCQQHEQPSDKMDPEELARGCKRLQALDVSPVDWSDGIFSAFVHEAPHLQSVALRHVAPHASPLFLSPLAAAADGQGAGLGCLRVLHLALHARSDPDRAESWLHVVAQLRSLRSLTLDYAAPLQLASIVGALAGFVGEDGPSAACCAAGLGALTIHGCHGVDGAGLRLLARACGQLQQLRLLPDSWRQAAEVGDAALAGLLEGLPRLRGLALGARDRLLDAPLEMPASRQLSSLSLFAPLGDGACAALRHWPRLRHLWLGPHKMMQHGVAAESCISDSGLAMVAEACPGLHDLTVASRLVTDAGVAALLGACRELRRVRLAGRGVTDASLVRLQGLRQPRLERLALWFSGVSAEGLRRAEEAMPWTYLDIELSDADT